MKTMCDRRECKANDAGVCKVDDNDCEDRIAPDLPDPEGVNKEIHEIGKMLTATTLPSDHKRYITAVSRLIVLYAKIELDAPNAEVCQPEGAKKS